MVQVESGIVNAQEAGLKACTACGRLQKIHDDADCLRCGAGVSSRRRNSLQRTWAFLIVGFIAYIPANIYPIMFRQSFTGDTSDTILSGVLLLVDSGSYFIAFVIFFASICIPVAKFVIITALAMSIHFKWDLSLHTRHRMHRVTEFIGRWSMVDVFVVAVLAALIQLGAFLTIIPGIGISAFAVSVVFTMLSASSLDPRLLWDGEKDGI